MSFWCRVESPSRGGGGGWHRVPSAAQIMVLSLAELSITHVPSAAAETFDLMGLRRRLAVSVSIYLYDNTKQLTADMLKLQASSKTRVVYRYGFGAVFGSSPNHPRFTVIIKAHPAFPGSSESQAYKIRL
ncbi:hypothetical protein F4861DRAFT_537158 [Xylaria intraflava]|nr:hypothetical protein F4861DRAFT_537158 [Xylaria intraflava]